MYVCAAVFYKTFKRLESLLLHSCVFSLLYPRLRGHITATNLMLIHKNKDTTFVTSESVLLYSRYVISKYFIFQVSSQHISCDLCSVMWFYNTLMAKSCFRSTLNLFLLVDFYKLLNTDYFDIQIIVTLPSAILTKQKQYESQSRILV